MSTTDITKIIAAARAALKECRAVEGALGRMSDAELDAAIAWAVKNDPSLLVDLDDEVDYRKSDFR